MNLSDKLKSLICDVVATQEFWRINYYLRSMKKAPHGGVFNNRYPNMFLKYYPSPSYLLFNPSISLPQPVLDEVSKFRLMIYNADLDMEEILRFCFVIDPDDHNDPASGNRMYLATCGKIITSGSRGEMDHMTAVMEAADGKITYIDNFNVDWERLVCAFVCTLVELHVYTIHDIEEIINHERLENPANKYGLFDVTNATFERQGFKLNEKYYLYNIFIDTSIGGASEQVPKTIQIILDIQPSVKILLRCDENLAVPYSQKVSTASWDFQKWRGITLDFSNITQQVTGGKEVIVHSDPETGHKILVYVKKDFDENGVEFYHLNVEQLWNPAILVSDEEVIITNFIHGTYYPSLKVFSHIDFSVNQYRTDVFANKYNDAVALTGIPIDKYGDEHYKIWCIEGESLNPEIWADLVCATIDAPFRSIFMETIGGSYTDDDQ